MQKIERKLLQPGMTLIEIVIVIVIIAIFAAFVGPKLFTFVFKSKAASTKNSLKLLYNEINRYKVEVGRLPENLESLLQKTDKWDGLAIGKDGEDDELPKGGWDEPLEYIIYDVDGSKKFAVYSYGDPDESKKTLYCMPQSASKYIQGEN